MLGLLMHPDAVEEIRRRGPPVQIEFKEHDHMSEYKIYNSKDDLYRDFTIALKFELETGGKSASYRDIKGSLSRDCRAKVEEFAQGVKNFRKEFPISTGFYVEIPVKGDAGEEMEGAKLFVLLSHETGWEWWLPITNLTTAGAAGYVAGKAAEQAFNGTLEAGLKTVLHYMRTEWRPIIEGGYRINHIEIRTEHKGTAKIKFSDFRIDSLECLLVHWDSIKHIMEANERCFFRNLYQT